MFYICDMLPYGILLLAAVISLFLKGSIVNKIMTILVLAAGVFCVCAESGWWRFGFILATGLICRCGQSRRYADGAVEPQFVMGAAIVVFMTIKWITADIFGWDPFWWTLIPAVIFGVMSPVNAAGCKED